MIRSFCEDVVGRLEDVAGWVDAAGVGLGGSA
jgi:hypothetical protein